MPEPAASHEHTGQHWREPARVRDFVARMDARAQERAAQFDLMTQLLGRDSDDALRILVGSERLAEFDGRYRYVAWDFGEGALPGDLDGLFDAVISSAAIHHLPEAALQRLYGAVCERLAPGGAFLNLDLVHAPDDALEARYREIAQAEQASRDEAPPPNELPRHHSHLEPLERHLGWLRDAGFEHVDCFWKRLGSALFGGYRPDNA